MDSEMESIDWTAEDVPAYMIDDRERRPRNDETATMSRPRVLCSDVTFREARQQLVLLLIKNRSYAERYGRGPLYTAAIDLIDGGYRLVRVEGRVFRLRQLSSCVPVHDHRGHCANCTPEDYPVLTTLRRP